jgi:signal transduction histidine kinase
VAVEKEKQPTPMIRDYWPRFKKRALWQIILMEVAMTLAIGCALLFTGVSTLNVLFGVTLFAVLAAAVGINIVLFVQLSAPLQDLTRALTHVSGEPTIVTPPNLNAPHFGRDGFRPLLQLIYTLATSDNTAKPDDDDTTEQTSGLATILDTTTTGVVALGANLQIVYANKAAPVHVDPTGARILDLVFEEETTLEKWVKDCEEHAVHSEKLWVRVADKLVGEEDRKIYDVAASYQKGSEAEVVLTLFDRTDAYQPEDDNLDFIAFAAHELRGPITVIRGYLDVLTDEVGPELKDDQIELLKRLVVSANRLSSYINNILNASRYDRRHLKVHLREESVADIYDTVKDDMQLRAASQNRLLSVKFPEDLPTIAADKGSISEVLSNLIDNALKYSNEGGLVQVSAQASGDSVKVAVQDNGIGMPGNVINNLFHKFYRSHRSRETVAGTGIGLYICKAIVESHGGKIEVRSIDGEGSTFEFSLPIYSTVAEKLKADNNSNESLINRDAGGWIKNHSMFRG